MKQLAAFSVICQSMDKFLLEAIVAIDTTCALISLAAIGYCYDILIIKLDFIVIRYLNSVVSLN